MAKKNYSQMTTKKLNALLNAASDDNEKALIQAELDARAAAAAEIANEPEDTTMPGGVGGDDVVVNELSETEQAEVAQAEANGGKRQAAPRMTDEERAALINDIRATMVNHRCEVLPIGKVTWVGGVITGITDDKRANNVMVVVKTDDGRTIRKCHNAETLRVLDEMVTPTGRTRRTGSKVDKSTPWDTMDEEINAIIGNVGKTVTFQYKAEDGSEVTTEGRVLGIVPDKRVKMLLYRIKLSDGSNKLVHKSSKASLTFSELDDEGLKLQEAYKTRRESERTPKSLDEKIAAAELKLKRAEESLVKAKAELEALRAKAEATVKAAEEPKAPATEPATEPAAEDLA